MAVTLTSSSINLDFRATTTDNQTDGTAVRDEFRRSRQLAYTHGTGNGKAQLCYHVLRSLATTTNETLDLQALLATFGTYKFTKIRAIVVELDTLNSGYRLEIGASAANQWAGASQALKDNTDIIRVPAGGRWLAESPVDGFTVDATHKTLKIDNPSGGTVEYRLYILGEGTIV